MYTPVEDPAVEHMVQSELDLITAHLVQGVRGLQGVVLVGGFGRGEGTVIEAGGRLQPYNDYDLVLIVDDDAPPTDLGDLTAKLLPQLTVRLLDFKTIPCRKLPRLKPIMFHVDLKYGSRTLWGDERLLARIPDYAQDSIPDKDAIVLLRNRLATYLEAYSEPEDGVRTAEQETFLERQSAKVVFACVDAALVRAGRYRTRYAEKVDAFAALAGDPGDLELARQAHTIRTDPGFRLGEGAGFWMRAGDLYRRTFRRLVGGGRRREPGPRGIVAYFLREEMRKIRRFLTRLPRRLLRSPLHGAQTLLLFSYGPGDPAGLRLARLLLRYYGLKCDANREDLRRKSVELWYKIAH